MLHGRDAMRGGGTNGAISLRGLCYRCSAVQQCVLYASEDVRIDSEFRKEHEEGADDDARPAEDYKSRVRPVRELEQRAGHRIPNERPGTQEVDNEHPNGE